VLTFKRSVKIIIDPASDPAMIYGLDLSLTLALTDPPIITGKSGKTHGARIVKIPAIKLIIRSNISIDYTSVNYLTFSKK
jgi:hypothetical protein